MNKVVTFEDSVKERIKSIVAELIPEEKWQALVDQEIKRFNQDDLPKLVREELRIMYQAQIREILASPELGVLNAQWQDGNYQLKGEMQKMLVDAAPTMFAAVMSNMAYGVINHIRSNAGSF